MTKTRERHEFLGKCLKDGMSRPEAARTMVKSELGKKKDGTRIKESTAITMVYQGYSGERFTIQTSNAPKKKSDTPKKKATTKASVKKTTTVPAKKKTSSKKAAIVKPKVLKQEVVKKSKMKEPVTKAKGKSLKEPAKNVSKPRKKKIEEGTELVF